MTHHCIKTDPAFQEDQEDLLMSYLNSDYMAPSSTTSPSPTTPKSHLVQELNYATAMAVSGFENNQDNWHSAPSTPSDDLFRQQQAIASCFHPGVLNNDLKFVIPSHEQMQHHHQSIASFMGNTSTTTTPNMMYAPPYFSQYNGPFLQQQQQQQQQQPTSPRSLSSYSSISDSEQPRKKRGRKKRDSCYSVASSSNSRASLTPPPNYTSNTPTVIAPAPMKHLPAILPAAAVNPTLVKPEHTTSISNGDILMAKKESCTESSSVPEATASATTIAPTANPNADQQKAATIAKRQERLIKNRAAALLSRKRKREHLSALEEQCTDLTSSNQSLLDKVAQLEKENSELKKKLEGKQPSGNTDKSTTTSTDFISMMILCYMVFIMSFSTSEGLGGLFTHTKLASDLMKSPCTLTSSSASFQLEPYHKECTSDKQKQTFMIATLPPSSPSSSSSKSTQRGRFQRVVL